MNNKYKEIFRYSDATEDFIGLISDFRDEFDEMISDIGGKNPLKNVSSPIWWVSITRTKKTAKKRPDYKINEDDALCAQGSTQKVKQAWDIVNLVSKWIEKESPDFLAISAYEDKSCEKRLRFYDRFLHKRNYKIIYIDYYNYNVPLIIYAKEGLDLKYKNICIDFSKI